MTPAGPADARQRRLPHVDEAPAASSPSCRRPWRPPTSAPRRRTLPRGRRSRAWATGSASGRLLYKGTWRSASLAVQFFDGSPALFASMSLDEARVLVRFVDALCDRSYDLASHCLSIAPTVLEPLTGEDRAAFLHVRRGARLDRLGGRALVPRERARRCSTHIQQMQRGRFLAPLARAGAPRGPAGVRLLRRGRAGARAGRPGVARPAAVARRGAGRALAAGRDGVPEDRRRACSSASRSTRSRSWHREGSNLLDQSPEGGEAYFRLESSRGEEMLEALSSRIELSRVSDILRMYGKALTGCEVAVHSAEALAEKGIGWVETEAPSTEGSAIFLPPCVEEFADKDENFQRLQGLLHAPGRPPRVRHVRVRVRARRARSSRTSARRARSASAPPPSRRSPLDSDGARSTRPDARRGRCMHEPLTDMERFFDLFPDRKLASDLFAIVEDARIDVLISRSTPASGAATASARSTSSRSAPPGGADCRCGRRSSRTWCASASAASTASSGRSS